MTSDLVRITSTTHPVLLDIAYATADNFTGAVIYSKPECYLHKAALPHFEKAIELAAKQHLTLKIFDAFRPLKGQWALWHHTPDPRYISHPEQGSIPHCRGVAIDLTLVTKDHKELPMGTTFDYLYEEAHHGCTTITEEEQRNRYLLMGIMMTAGWDFYRNEWWHYQLFNCRNYPVVQDSDAPF
jgi:D-alanyl-D-alanine dipeptidase